MSESPLKDDLLITPFSPDDDEELRQFRKGIKIFKPLQLSIPFSALSKEYVPVRALSPKEEKLGFMDQLTTDKATTNDHQNVPKKLDDNSSDDVFFDKSSVNCQKQPKEQNKNTYNSEKIKNRSFIRYQSAKNTSPPSNSLSTPPTPPASPIQTNKRSKKG